MSNLEQSMLVLRENSQFLQSVLMAMVDTLIVTNTEGKILMVNHAAEELLGWCQDELFGQPVHSLLSEEDPEEVDRWLQEVRQGISKTHHETFFVIKSEEKVSVEVSCSSVKNEEAIEGIIFVARDLTDKKLMEGQLLHGQKLEAIGQLAAGVAHEINTPMQYIRDNVEFLGGGFNDFLVLDQFFQDHVNALKNTEWEGLSDKLEEMKRDLDFDYFFEEAPKSISQTLEGIDHVTKIVRSLKAFSHPGSENKVIVDLAQLLDHAITVTRNEWKYVAKVDTDFDETVPKVSCYVDELNQVILNLIINAAHAIEEALRGQEKKQGKITLTTRKLDDSVEICITDNGTGIPKEIQDKVYDPFFTTKEVGKGTGQGLSIAHSIIVDKHQGQINLKSEPGRTSFKMQIPLKG